MRTFLRLCLQASVALFALCLLLTAPTDLAVLGQAVQGCAYASSGRFVLLSENAPEHLNIDTLAAVDGYLRTQVGDDERDHVLIFFEDTREINALTDTSHDWTGWVGATFRRQRWNWQTCAVDGNSDTKVDLFLVQQQTDSTALFGLIVHELSQSNGRADASQFWQRIALKAHHGRCYNLSGDMAEHCRDIRAILDEGA